MKDPHIGKKQSTMDASATDKMGKSPGPKMAKHDGQVGKTPQPTYKGGRSYC